MPLTIEFPTFSTLPKNLSTTANCLSTLTPSVLQLLQLMNISMCQFFSRYNWRTCQCVSSYSVCLRNQFTSNHCLDCSVYVWYCMLIFVKELSELTLVKKPPRRRFNTWATSDRLSLRDGLWLPTVEVCRRHMAISVQHWHYYTWKSQQLARVYNKLSL
jgi:hypothetical protein